MVIEEDFGIFFLSIEKKPSIERKNYRTK